MPFRVKVRIKAGPIYIDEVMVIKDATTVETLENLAQDENFAVVSIIEEDEPLGVPEAIALIRSVIEAAGGR